MVQGRYCSVCGQENTVPHETVWHLLSHFFNDITHFDGKFFSTLKLLILKPGFLSAEYKMGRRASYLNPVRMYVFTSAIFFLVFFSVYHFEVNNNADRKYGGKSYDQIVKLDSASFTQHMQKLNKKKLMNRADFDRWVDSTKTAGALELDLEGEYKTVGRYDSLLASGKIHDGWIKRLFIRRSLEINAKYKNDQAQIINAISGSFIHSFPQMLFISLPLFALFLKLIYRRSRDFYYVSHAIFSIHFYIFSFLVLLVLIGLDKLTDYTHWSLLGFLEGILYILIFFYEYKAMRRFYGQRRGKTILKFILLNLWLMFIVMLIFILFVLFSFFKA